MKREIKFENMGFNEELVFSSEIECTAPMTFWPSEAIFCISQVRTSLFDQIEGILNTM